MKNDNVINIVRRDPRMLGLRIALLGISIGFVGFFLAIAGSMYIGASIAVIALVIVFIGFAVHFSKMRYRR